MCSSYLPLDFLCCNVTDCCGLGTVYINSYLATLNAREALFEKGGVVSIHMSQMAAHAHFGPYGSGEDVYGSQPSTVLNPTKVYSPSLYVVFII